MIYVDCTECTPKGAISFHGGANYGKRAVALLAKSGKEITVFLNEGYKIESIEDKRVFNRKEITIEYIKDIKSFNSGSEKDILFIPMIPTRRINIVKEIKQKNKGMRIFVTIHGVRQLDLKPDILDQMYVKGKINIFNHIYAVIQHRIKSLIYIHMYKKYVRYIDRVFTVSNDSMQKIQKICKPKYIKHFYEGSLNSEDVNVGKEIEDYYLVVSGGRPEKNLLRILLAFQDFKKKNENNIKLIATGVPVETQKKLLSYKKLDASIVSRFVNLLPYIDSDQLSTLYLKCRLVIYMSKSEGFGLPLVEAAMHNKPVLTSSITAMPEVLSSGAHYANPYDIESISNELSRICATDNNILMKQITRTKDLVTMKIENSDQDFVMEFN